MGKQTNLEKKGFEKRAVELVKNDYNSGEEFKYTESHVDALSDATKTDKPLGKGTGKSHMHLRPDASKPTSPDYSNFDTFNGGGSYDIYGRNEIGGRNRIMTYNIYGPTNAYTPESIDTSLAVEAGQVVIK
jgi:hypothetical protein